MENVKLRSYVKNLFGPKTSKKIVVFSVDDYGTQRTSSSDLLIKLKNIGVSSFNRFDLYDSLETADDLELLFDVLTSVKDSRGSYAKFTPMALCANPNFTEMKKRHYSEYVYETLPDTYKKIQGNTRTLDLIKEGVRTGIFVPQFHGREHMNLNLMMNLLRSGDKCIITNFENNSYSAIHSSTTNLLSTAAFDFESLAEIEMLEKIIVDGLNLFEKVYGYRAIHFSAPGKRESLKFASVLKKSGIKLLDSDFIRRDPTKKICSIHYTGKENLYGQRYVVRNVVFEPMAGFVSDPIDIALKEIDVAFKMHKIANISSHRVNFSGGISKRYRDDGLKQLLILLKRIVHLYPDVEFRNTDCILDLVH